MSSHSDGLGSRNGWNSPDHTNNLVPSIISEYGSNVIRCAGAAAAAPASSVPAPALAGAAPEAAAETTAGLAARPAVAASTAPVSTLRRETPEDRGAPGAAPAGPAGPSGSVGAGIVGTPCRVGGLPGGLSHPRLGGPTAEHGLCCAP